MQPINIRRTIFVNIRALNEQKPNTDIVGFDNAFEISQPI